MHRRAPPEPPPSAIGIHFVWPAGPPWGMLELSEIKDGVNKGTGPLALTGPVPC